jgi:hypothetical protein
MAYDRFLIGPFETGLQTNTRAWLIMDDAFEQLDNAYVFRGRVRKRFGSRFMGSGWTTPQAEPLFSRFRINLGNTDGSGDISVTVPGNIFAIGQQFSIGTEIFTVIVTGTPGVMLTTGASTTHTYNTTTGALVIDGAAAATAVWFCPAQPVMGLTNYEVGPINDQPSYGFDTQFAYLFAGGFWQRSGTGTSPFWHGTNLNFFWATNYKGSTPNQDALFVSNFYVLNPNGAVDATDDGIWYTQDGSTWTEKKFYFRPAGGSPTSGPYVETALMIFGFKGCLVFLNTIESDGSTNTQYAQRARWSWQGSPFADNAFYEAGQFDNSMPPLYWGGGGFRDASTEEAIVSAEFIKDRLIVYFQESTWELVFTYNTAQPFEWQKINTELGSEATFSTVGFDKQILTIGNTGVHACNGANVERIDTKIPDQIFQIVDKNSGVERVAGIRDYYTEMVYWTFPAVGQNPIEVYPTKVLVYNYRNGSWAFNDDCITTWGYFEQQNGMTWASTTLTWEEANLTWGSGSTQAQFRQVIAGNQQGYTFIIDASGDTSNNAQAMQITNITTSGNYVQLTIIDHTLNVTPYGDYINLANTGVGLDGIFKVQQVIDTNNILIGPGLVFAGPYLGGGSAGRVSNIQILTKQWNPYVEKSKDVFLAKIDFGVQKTSDGEITVDYYPSSSEVSMLTGATETGSIQGTGVLETFPYDPTYYPLEQYQTRLWHPIYFQSDGECIQLFMYFTDAQITNPAIAFSDFELEGMVLHTQPTTSRLQ